MGIFWKEKVLLLKAEGTYGVDPTPTGAANAILATNVDLRPMEGDDVSRNLEQHFFGNQITKASALRAVLTFDTELAGSGSAGVAPAWGPIALACAFAQTIEADTSVTYTRVKNNQGSAHIYFWVGGTRYVLKGARGTGVMTLSAQGIPVVRWTLTGLWTAPTDTAQATPTLTGWLDPKIAAKANTPTFTINGVTLKLRSYSLNFGSDVQVRLLVNHEEIIIVDHAEQLDVVVEAVALATLNPFALAVDPPTLVPVALVHGTVAGNIVTVNIPDAQMRRPAGLQNNQGFKEWPLVLAPIPDAGNDQLSIVLT